MTKLPKVGPLSPIKYPPTPPAVPAPHWAPTGVPGVDQKNPLNTPPAKIERTVIPDTKRKPQS